MTHPDWETPGDTWEADLLGDGFQARTLPLRDDDEGACVATLIRYCPASDPTALPDTPDSRNHPRFVMLHLHGWNDYFYHSHLARTVAHAGGAFYALDLRKYGRSLRPHQTRGFVTDLATYDEDIHEALQVIRAEHGYQIGLVLMGHSTGGLTASMWAARHPGALHALILNSPWLALQGSALVKLVSQPVADALRRHNPKQIFPLPDSGFYSRTLQELGWTPNQQWRTIPSPPVRAGWLSAVLSGHTAVAEGLDITCPVLVLTSQASDFVTIWDDTLLGVDSVLDVTEIWAVAHKLGPHVTLVRIAEAVHDVFLSREPARLAAAAELERFLAAYS